MVRDPWIEKRFFAALILLPHPHSILFFEINAAEAQAAAAEEGLSLVRAENSTGFKYVRRDPKSVSKPFKAELRHGGRFEYLGYFATAEEAALAIARFLGPKRVAAALAPAAPKPTPMTAAEAHAAAASEGLALLRGCPDMRFKRYTNFGGPPG